VILHVGVSVALIAIVSARVSAE